MPVDQSTEVSPRIAYEDQGQGGPALLLFTGWCSSRQRWAEAARLMARHRRVVSFEWRGHGDSESSPGDFGQEEMVTDALAVADAAGLSSFVPCAASHSGWVAIELAQRYPDRIPALVHFDWMVSEPSRRYMSVIDQLTSPEEWRQARDTLFAIWRAGVSTPPIDRAIEVMRSQDAEMWMRSGREIGSAYRSNGSPLAAWSTLEDQRPVLHSYGQPTDPAYLALQEEFAASNPWFEVTHIPAVTHFAMLENAAAVDSAVVEFLNRNELG